MICIVQIPILMFQRCVISSYKDKEIMSFRTCCKLIQKTFLISDKFYIDCYMPSQIKSVVQKASKRLIESQMLFSY